MPADLLLYAVAAAGLVFWLRSLLGTRHGDERQRPNPFLRPRDPSAAPLGARAALPSPAAADAGDREGRLAALRAGLGRGMSAAPQAEDGLLALLDADRGFDLSRFMAGAQDAFVIIAEAYAAGDRETLSGLLSPALYGAFGKALSAREEKGETASLEIHAVRRAEITDARLSGKTAYITVRFTADETSVVRDREGCLLSGHPDRVAETVDVWTFGRDVKSRDPAWRLFETRAAEEGGASPGSGASSGGFRA